MKTFFRLCVFGLSLFSLVACGGGDGGGPQAGDDGTKDTASLVWGEANWDQAKWQ